jgi:DNA-binding CsgD family transcriptional regulator
MFFEHNWEQAMSAHQFTQAQAEAFVCELFQEIFSQGDTAQLLKYYLPNLIGHYQDETFNLHDIEQRVLTLKNNTKQRQFLPSTIMRVNQDYLAMSCKQIWTHKADESLYDSLVFGLYRLENRKVAEVWIIQEFKTPSYIELNQDFAKHMKPYELSQKSKHEFLQRLNLKVIEQGLRLSEIEKDCLYYYFHGFSAKETAAEMQISPRTVETYLANIKERLACSTKRELRKKLFPELKE